MDRIAKASGRLDPRCGYFMKVFGEQWVAPGRTPSMLDLSRDASLMSLAFARLGFEVVRIRLDDEPLDTLGGRLDRLAGRFDVVCCYDVIERLDDWQGLLGRIARRLRPGGLFLYSVEASAPNWLRGAGRWLRGVTGGRRFVNDGPPSAGEVVEGLRAARFLPREMVSLGRGGRWWSEAGTVDDAAGTFAGYAVRDTDQPAGAAPMRWEFQGTGDRWLVGRAVTAPLVARIGGR